MDYRALLLKYMRCCIECDGATHLMWNYPDGLLSTEEQEELELIAGEAKFQHQLAVATRRLESATLVSELTRRDEEAGIRYPEEPFRACCFEGCPKCQPKDEGPSMAALRAIFKKSVEETR